MRSPFQFVSHHNHGHHHEHHGHHHHHYQPIFIPQPYSAFEHFYSHPRFQRTTKKTKNNKQQ